MEAITTDTLTERMDSMQESDKVRAERVRTGQQYGAGQEGIDLFNMMDDALRCFQKYWLQFLLLIVIVTAVFIIYGNRQYVPQYQAKVTYAGEIRAGDSDTDASIAQRTEQQYQRGYENRRF